MTVVDGGGRSKDGPYKDEPKTQGHTPCLGHPQFEEVGFGGGACNRKNGGALKLASKIGASRVNKPPHSKVGKATDKSCGLGAQLAAPLQWQTQEHSQE